MIIALCWTTWHERNQFVFQSKARDPHFLVAKAEATVEAYERVKMSKMETAAKAFTVKTSSEQIFSQRHFKVNVDAAINRDTYQGGLGVVIRDGEGNVIAAAIKQTNFNGDAALVEAAAVKLGIQVAIDTGLTPLIIETDCKDVVNLVLHKKSNQTEICWIITDIQSEMQRGGNLFKFQHIPRENNVIAHNLAKMAVASGDSCIWRDSFPPQVMSVITHLI